jgi:hypothetical protein
MLQEDGRLWRNYKDGNAVINAFLDDYALLAKAYVALYEATFDEKWLNKAKNVTDYALANFSDESNALMFYTSKNDPALVARKKETSDNVIPAANSVMANNLYVLGKYFDSQAYTDKAEDMLSYVRSDLEKYGIYYANWSNLLASLSYGTIELAMVGEKALDYRKSFDDSYFAATLMMGSEKESDMPLLEQKYIEGQTTIYVCRNKVCDLPVTEVSEAIAQIRAIHQAD